MNSLVTGGAGFIGSHVAKYCQQLGHKAVILDDLSGGFKENIPYGTDFILGSVCDHNLVNRLFEKYQFDYVYHLAAYAAEGLSHFIRRFNYSNNLIGSINLINAAINAGTVKRFVFTSSIAVYGMAQTPMTEYMVPRPEDPYGIAKYAFELDLAAAHELFGLEYTIFRPHNVYGENQNIGDRYRNVIGIFMNQLMCDQPMTIFGDGRQTRAFSYIEDIAPVIANSVEEPRAANEVFNIGADQPISVLDLAHEIAKAFGKPPLIKHLPPRLEVVHAFSSHEKAKQIFGIPESLPLDKGIKRMAEWAQEQGPRMSRHFQFVEVISKMPEFWKNELTNHNS